MNTQFNGIMQYVHDEIIENGLSEEDYKSRIKANRSLVRGLCKGIQQCREDVISDHFAADLAFVFYSVYGQIMEKKSPDAIKDPDTLFRALIKKTGIKAKDETIDNLVKQAIETFGRIISYQMKYSNR